MAPVDELEPVYERITIPPLRAPSFVGDSQAGAAEFRRQRDAARLGAALLVIAAGVSFAALIVAYAAFRAGRAEAFLFGRYYLNPELGLLASLSLLLSAFTSGLAARCAALDRPFSMGFAIAATIALGAAFLAIQSHDFWNKIETGLLPGARFVPTEEVWSTDAFRREQPAATELALRLDARWLTITGAADPALPKPGEAPAAHVDARSYGLLRKVGVLGPSATLANVPSRPRNAHVFWGLYLLMMGTHSAYLLAGLALWVSVLVRSRRGGVALPVLMRIDSVTLFWQFLAMVWVVLFPLFYLVH